MNVKGSKENSSQLSAFSPQSLKAGTFQEELKELHKNGLLRKTVCLDSSCNSKILIKGQKFINFSSNDYLGLSAHPHIVKAAVAGLKRYGLGSGSSRLLSGTCLPHVKLEERIAAFKKTGASIVFNTGYAANTGAIPALAGPDAHVFSDELNHASIVDGIRLSKAGVEIYRHRDMDHLESLLKKYSRKKSVQRKLVITDTVFSMDGDIAPLKDIALLCSRYEALMMIDDAHGTGVLGKTGRGGLEHCGIKSDNIIQMGTLSKAAGCYGAFIAGRKDMVNVLVNRARSFMYSTSLPPAVAAAGIRSIDILDSRSKKLRKTLWNNRDRLFKGIKQLGYDTLGSETPIIPVLVGSARNALRLERHLRKNALFVPAIRPPTVADGRCRIRFSVTAGHTSSDIDLVLESLSRFK